MQSQTVCSSIAYGIFTVRVKKLPPMYKPVAQFYGVPFIQLYQSLTPSILSLLSLP